MKIKLLTFSIAMAGLGAMPNLAVAQKQALVREEVVVTARRRQESLQEVPISVTALDSKTMERLKLERPEDLQFQTPSLMVQGASSDSLQMGIRGQFIADALGTTDSPVNIYFGEALVSRPMGTNHSMYDLESVQVLKGVQGTLFGRNSTGGAVLVKPAAPTEVFEGYLRGSVGNYQHQQIDAVANLPVTDTVAMRVAGKTLRRDGYAENVATGDDLEDADLKAWRVSLRWRPTDSVESLTIYDHYEHDYNGGNAYALSAIDPTAASIAGYNQLAAASQSPLSALFPSLATAFPGGASLATILAEQQARGPRDVMSEIGTGRPDQDFWGKQTSTAENWGIQNITSVEFNKITLKNIIAYREMEYAGLTDLDGSIAGLIGSRQGGAFDFMSEEFQVLGTAFDDKLDWLVGLYYMNEEGSDRSVSNQFNALSVEGARIAAFTGQIPGVTAGDVNVANAVAAAAGKWDITAGDVENTAKAIYTGLTYHIDDNWTLAGGLRYTEDKREYIADSRLYYYNLNQYVCSFVVEQGGSFVPLALNQCNQGNEETFEKVTYDATLSYKFDSGSMVYGAYRFGYRAGGFNGRARSFVALEPYNPEEVTEYELGFKSDFDLGSMPVRANGAVFYQDYEEIQRQTPVNLGGNTVATVIENAAQGNIEGLELELEARPADWASISLFYSYIDGEFDKYIDPGTGADLSDLWLARAPKNTAGVTVNLFTSLQEYGELVWTFNAYHQSLSHLSDREEEIDQDGYSLFNASVAWEEVAGSNFSLHLWGRNLTDREYKASGISLMEVAGYASAFYGPPRTYGLDVTYKFGQ